jgi:hypothetical protein
MLRLGGIPFVTSKAIARVGDDFHASHLTVFDVMDQITKAGGADGIRVLQRAMFRNAKPTQNISSQNLAEAARRIVQHADDGRTFTDASDLQILRDAVRDALENISGRPVNAKAKDLIAQNKVWMQTPDGVKAIDELTSLLVSDDVVASLLRENHKQRLLMAALAKGDGYQMTNDLLTRLGDLPGETDKLYGLGSLIMGKGLRDIFSADTVSRMTPDQMNIAYAEQALARYLDALSPENIQLATQTYKNVEAMKASAALSSKTGKPEKSPRNKEAVEQNKEAKPDVDKLVDDQLKNDPNAKAAANSEEEARLSLGFYSEIHYGAMMGGFVKLASKVWDPANMTRRGKQLLQRTEQVLLDNPIEMAASLNRIRNMLGRSSVVVNKIFKELQSSGSGSIEDIAAAIAKLPEAEQEAANLMMRRIDDIFGNGQINNMMSSKIFADEYARALQFAGVEEHANLFRLARDEDPASMANYWRQLDIPEGMDALDMMAKHYNATQVSQLKPSLAASLVNNFGHQTYGFTRAEAIAQGFKAIDDSTDFGKFLQIGKEPTLFPPEMLRAIRAMDKHLDYDRGFGAAQNLINKMDAITSVLKSSITIWRPGHHMVNLVGGALMNTLEGVAVMDYVTGVKMLAARGAIDGADDRFLARIMSREIPEGKVLKGDPLNGTLIPIMGANGKVTYQSVDLNGMNYLADNVGGAYIAERFQRDVTGTGESLTARATQGLMASAPVRGIQFADNQLARFSAARDNILRMAMFNKFMRTGGPFKSVEEAALYAAQKVHEYHPTVGTLTAAERKYARRAFYFYTWQKQALFKIMEYSVSAAGGPAKLSVPFKFQYALAEAQGLNPASFGDPHDPSKAFAAYSTESVYGPQAVDELWGAIGVRPAFPQADVIDAYLGRFQTRPELGFWENMGHMTGEAALGIIGENMPPAARIPAELLARQRFGGIGGDIDNVPEYLLDQTGLGVPSRMLDRTPWGTQRSDTKLDRFSEVNRDRLWWNWVGGMKFTYYESPASLQVGRQELIDYWRRTFGQGKYAPKIDLYEYRRTLEERGMNE